MTAITAHRQQSAAGLLRRVSDEAAALADLLASPAPRDEAVRAAAQVAELSLQAWSTLAEVERGAA